VHCIDLKKQDRHSGRRTSGDPESSVPPAAAPE